MLLDLVVLDALAEPEDDADPGRDERLGSSRRSGRSRSFPACRIGLGVGEDDVQVDRVRVGPAAVVKPGQGRGQGRQSADRSRVPPATNGPPLTPCKGRIAPKGLPASTISGERPDRKRGGKDQHSNQPAAVTCYWARGH